MGRLLATNPKHNSTIIIFYFLPVLSVVDKKFLKSFICSEKKSCVTSAWVGEKAVFYYHTPSGIYHWEGSHIFCATFFARKYF